MSDYDGQWAGSFLFGAVFLAAYFLARFAGPFADRSYTTFYRYSVAVGYYAIGYLALYYLIVAFGSWALRALLAEPGGLLGLMLRTPGWVALVIVILSRVPGLSQIDQLFRNHVRHVGGIPTEAKRLRDAIRAARCEIREDSSNEIHHTALRRGLDLGNMRAVPDYTLHALFLQASELKHFLEKCGQDRRFAGFFADNARPLHDLSRRFDHLLFKSSRGVAAIGGLSELVNRASGKSDTWDSLGSLVESEVYAGKSNVLDPAISTSRMLLNNIRDDMRFFIDDTAMFLARLALFYRWSEHGRVALLRQLGIPVAPVQQPRYRLLLVVFVVVFVAMFIGMTSFGTAGERTAREVAGLMLMVPTLFVAALFCAIYPKQYFAFANTSLFGRPPYGFFLCAGLAAGTLSFFIGLAFRTLIYQDGEVALQRGLANSPWLLISFTVAVVVAVLVQDGRTFESAARRDLHRWRDAAILAIALGAASALVQLLLPYTYANPELPRRWWSVAVSVLIGAFIGFFVPSRFRHICEKDPCPAPAHLSAGASAETGSSPLAYSKAS